MIELVIFALMALAAVWLLLRSGRSRGTSAVRGGTFFTPQRWIGPSPSGSWTEIDAERPLAEIGFWLFIGVIAIFAWTMVNVPEMFTMSVIYLFMLVFYTIAWTVEAIRPKLRWAAVLGTGRMGKGILFGLVAGTVWVGVESLLAMQAEVPLLALAPLAVWAIWGFAIPVAEEAVFTGMILPTAVEDFGIVPGLLSKAALFTVFHWLAYAQSFPLLAGAFGFSIVAGVLALRMRSIVIAVAMHIAVNTVWILLALAP